MVCQKQAIKQTGENSACFVTAVTGLRLLEREQAAIIEELGYNPRVN